MDKAQYWTLASVYCPRKYCILENNAYAHRFSTSPQQPDQLWDLSSLLSNRYHRVKEPEQKDGHSSLLLRLKLWWPIPLVSLLLHYCFIFHAQHNQIICSWIWNTMD